MSTSNIFVAHPPTYAAPTSRVTLARMLAVVASLLLVSTFVLSNSRAAFTADTSAGGTWDTAEVALSSDATDGVTFTADSNLVPGDVVSGQVQVTYDGSAESVDIALLADNLAQQQNLADVLNLTISDGTNTYTGTLTDLAASAGVLPWPGAASGETRTYTIDVEVDPTADNAYANGVASVDFIWHAESNATHGQG